MTPSCPDCARKATQVASLAHTAAELRAELAGCRDNAREVHRENTTEVNALEVSRDHYRACTRNLHRRLRLARWAGAVAADAQRVQTRRAAVGAIQSFASMIETAVGLGDMKADRDRYRAVVEAGVAGLARSWRAT